MRTASVNCVPSTLAVASEVADPPHTYPTFDGPLTYGSVRSTVFSNGVDSLTNLGASNMAHVRVQYTHKRGNHYNPHERIQGLAGDAGGGWYRSESAVLNDLVTNSNDYFVSIGGREVTVIRAFHDGRPYLKTVSDGYSPDNLLALPEPPSRLIP